MLTIIDNDIRRGTEKIGWFRENDIYNQTGRKAGWYEDHYIYDATGRKVAYIENDSIKTIDGRTVARLEENRARITGGALSDLARAAIRVLLGD